MFKNAILTQVVCFIIIVLSCLSLGFGSWLETNNLLYLSSPSVSHRLSVYKVNLVSTKDLSNLSQLSFGLWRYCISNDLNDSNACSPVQINFDIDTFGAIENIPSTNNYSNKLPSLPAVSYVRMIPLLLATLFGVLSFGISLFLLPSNNKKSVQRKALLWLNSILCLMSAALISISFGATIHQYSSDIEKLCTLLKSDYICQSYTLGLESILLALAIGLFTVSSAYCFFITSALSTKLTNDFKTEYQNSSSYSFYAATNEGNQSNRDLEEGQPPSMTEVDSSMDESIKVWNTNKDRLSLRPPPPNNSHKQQKAGCRSSSSDNNSPLKLDKKVTNLVDSNADPHSVKPRLGTSSVSLATTTLMASTKDIKFTSSSPLDKDILLPPTLPFANGGRPTYNHDKNRPLSYDSANTFGAFYSGQNSPAADDCSINSATSYMDISYQRSDSVTSHNNSHLMYATSATGGTQSNHTLGTFPLYNTTTAGSEKYTMYNSSYEEVDVNKFTPTPLNISRSSLAEVNVNTAPTPIEQLPISPENNNVIAAAAPPSSTNKEQLLKRINSYLQKK